MQNYLTHLKSECHEIKIFKYCANFAARKYGNYLQSYALKKDNISSSTIVIFQSSERSGIASSFQNENNWHLLS